MTRCSPRAPFLAARQGSAVPLVGLTLAGLFGATALAVDMGQWRIAQDKLQRTVDAAALSITRARTEGVNTEAATKRLLDIELAVAGFTVAKDALTSRVTLTTEETMDLEASIQTVSYFGGPLGVVAPRITARAGVTGALSGTPLCMVSMKDEPALRRGISVENGGRLTIPRCRMHSNATTRAQTVGEMEGAITIDNARVEAASLCAVGGIAVRGPHSPVGLRHENCDPVQDPLGHLAEPVASGACLPNPASEAPWTGTRQLVPGNYCDGLALPPGTAATFRAGIYFISGGDLVFEGADPWSSNGVSFIITGPGTARWNESANISSFSAPTSGPTAGVFIWRTDDHPCDTPIVFSGAASKTVLNFDGAIYAPNCEIRFVDQITLRTRNRFTVVAAETVTVSSSAKVEIHASAPYGEPICRPTGTGPVKLARPTPP